MKQGRFSTLILLLAIATVMTPSLVIEQSVLSARSTGAGLATSGELSITCPANITIGVINVPPGWTDYNRRVIPLDSLTFTNGAKGSQVACNYDKGKQAVDRFVPGRICKVYSFDTVNCRAIPTKK